MTNVLPFTGETTVDLDPDTVLENAIGKLESVFICGYTKDGEEFMASNKSDGAENVWMLERAKYKLLKWCDSDN